MILNLPPDPSLKDLQLVWEKQYWYKKRGTWRVMIKAYEGWMKFFGEGRKPRDIFRTDVAAYKIWLTKRGLSDSSINALCHNGARLYRLLDELELVEAGFNPFTGMAPRRIRL